MRRGLLVALLIIAAVPAGAGAQERDCTYVMLTPEGRTAGVLEGDVQITLLYDPFQVTCDDGTRLSASSGRINNTTREVFLYGNVAFQDGPRSLSSDQATYNANTAWLRAEGSVVFVDNEEGTTLRGPELEYFRVTESRPVSQLTAPQRPTLTFTPRTSEGASEPMDLVADLVTIVGEDDLSASGAVEVTRTDFRATSGEFRYNAATEDLELRQNARVQSEEYVLTGEVIQSTLVDGAIEYLRARSNARAQGRDLLVTGSDLQLFFEEELLQRAVAVGTTEGEEAVQAEARSAEFRLVADSLDARFVDERLDEVVAIGAALGESIDTTSIQTAAVADTARVDVPPAQVDSAGGGLSGQAESALATFRTDWIRGDTITGYFESTAAESPDSITSAVVQPPSPEVEPDNAGDDRPDVELRRLVAVGSAQSLYRMRPEGEGTGDAADHRRNLNFLVGERIELDLIEGELSVAQVSGLQYGIYLEAPSSDGAGVPVSDGDVPATSQQGDR